MIMTSRFRVWSCAQAVVFNFKAPHEKQLLSYNTPLFLQCFTLYVIIILPDLTTVCVCGGADCLSAFY